MLTIRREQLKALEVDALERYVHELANYIRTEDSEEEVFPPGGTDFIQVKDLPENMLVAMVKAGVARARNHGFTLDCDIAAFVSLMFSFAPNFDTQATIQTVLSDQEFTPEERMDMLVELVGEEGWDQAEEFYDESAWGLRP